MSRVQGFRPNTAQRILELIESEPESGSPILPGRKRPNAIGGALGLLAQLGATIPAATSDASNEINLSSGQATIYDFTGDTIGTATLGSRTVVAVSPYGFELPTASIVVLLPCETTDNVDAYLIVGLVCVGSLEESTSTPPIT